MPKFKKNQPTKINTLPANFAKVRFSSDKNLMAWKHLAKTKKNLKNGFLAFTSGLGVLVLVTFGYLFYGTNNRYNSQFEVPAFASDFRELNLQIDGENKPIVLDNNDQKNLKVESSVDNLEDSTSSQSSNQSSDSSSNQSSSENSTSSSQGNGVKILQKVALAVPYRAQIYRLSCEVASLQMALAHFGVNVAQKDLQEELGVSLPLKKQNLIDQNGLPVVVWGNPDEGFVGDVEGWYYAENNGKNMVDVNLENELTNEMKTEQGNIGNESSSSSDRNEQKDEQSNTKNEPKNYLDGTGWGVNNGPLAKLAQKYRPKSFALDKAKIDDLETALNEGSPVIMWHIRDDADKGFLDYQATNGNQYKVRQTHVKVLTGFDVIEITDPKTGKKTTKTSYFFNDPFFGQDIELDKETMLRQWARYENNIVVVK